MHSKSKALSLKVMAGVALILIVGALSHASAQQAGVQASASRPVGAIKAIAGNTITLTTDSGAQVNVLVQPSTRLVRIAPGQTDLKNAAPVQLQELQPSDRILVRGTASADGKTVLAASIILMKAADVAQQKERERQDWDKRGTGGLVGVVDIAAGTVQLKTTSFTGTKTVTVRTTKDTIVRRYAPGSVKFEDAVRATLDQIKPGDQLRARGNRNADGTEIAAEEIVAGTFRNIAGTVASVDPAAQTLTVNDVATKKPVVLKIAADSQLHKLPETIAQMIAFRLRGTSGGAAGERGMGAVAARGAAGARTGEPGMAGMGGAPRNGGGGDLHQILSRVPAVTLAELQKGDAVMIVTTQLQASPELTVITLLTGVDPILRASNDGTAAMLLSPWNLGGGESGNQ